MAGLGEPQVFAPVGALAPAAAPVAQAAPLPFAPFLPVAAVAVGETTLRDPLVTSPDHVDVEIEAPPASRAPYGSAVTPNELLERATSLGPARMTWESIVLPTDPVLNQKRQPHVAERRERFTRMVKIGLGACVAVCAIALGVSTLSGGSPATSSSASSEALGKTVPSKGIVPVEALGGNLRAKSVRRIQPTVATAAIVRGKRH